jgi:hypothetical protein
MNNKPKFSNEAGPPASISRNPPALTIHLAWSEARLVRFCRRFALSWQRNAMLKARPTTMVTRASAHKNSRLHELVFAFPDDEYRTRGVPDDRSAVLPMKTCLRPV